MKHMKEPDQDLVSGSRLNISWAVANETLQGTKGLLGHVGGANETQTTQGGEGRGEGTIAAHAKQGRLLDQPLLITYYHSKD